MTGGPCLQMLEQVINSNVDVEFNPPIVPEVKFANPAVDVHAKLPHFEAKVKGPVPGAIYLVLLLEVIQRKKNHHKV